jgi:exodeoxyribonuclease VII small subunit
MATAEEPELRFEEALGELERIVGALERGDSELSDALAQYERGVRLLGRCHQWLDAAEQTVALLTGVDEGGNPQTAPFDATATAERERPAPQRRSTRRQAPATNTDDGDVPF